MFLLLLLLFGATADAHVSQPVCTSSYVYRLNDGESEKGGWESKVGQIIVQSDPRLELHGPIGMLVCTNGDTRIEFFKP